MAPLKASETVAPAAPVTYERPVPTDLDSRMDSPSVPRAQLAATPEKPQGSADFKDPNGQSVLQQHVEFFDRRKTGVIMPWDTYDGFRALGWNIFFSVIFTFILNSSLSYATQDGWIPDPLLSVKVRNIHKAKHGSDTHVYDYEGRFCPEKFEALFTQFDHGNKGGLNFNELLEMTEKHRLPYDFFGWMAEKLEWGLTWWLLRDENGLVSKESIRGSYDGSIYYRVEAARKAMKKEE